MAQTLEQTRCEGHAALDFSTRIVMSENGEQGVIRRSYNDTHDARFGHLLPRATGS